MKVAAASIPLRARLRRWVLRRHGPAADESVLDRRRLYVLPTRAGLVYAVLLMVMLIGAMNYGSSTGYALTFLLAGMGLVAMHHGHRNLLGLGVRVIGAEPVFAGERAAFRVRLRNASAITRHELRVRFDDAHGESLDLAPESHAEVTVPIPTRRRGRLRPGPLCIESRFPGHLVRVWSWCAHDASVIVYPAPAAAVGPPPASASGADDGEQQRSGDTDFWGLREFRPGDPTRRIEWRAYARERGLVVRTFSDPDAAPEWLAPDPLAELEAELSRLARHALDLARAGRPFGLRLDGQTLDPAGGQAQLHRVLGALALYRCGDDDVHGH